MVLFKNRSSKWLLIAALHSLFFVIQFEPPSAFASPHLVCNLNPSASQGVGESTPEHGSCVQAQLLMGTPPGVNQSRVLSVKVQAVPGVAGAAPIRISLPAGISFTAVPKGFQNTLVDSGLENPRAAMLSDGTVRSYSQGTITLSSGKTTTLQFTIHTNKPGAGHIKAWVRLPDRLRMPGRIGGLDSLHLSYGLRANETHWGVPSLDTQLIRNVLTTIPVHPNRMVLAAGRYCPGGKQLPQNGKACAGAIGLAGSIHINNQVHAQATACSKGKFVYSDHNGVVHPSVNLVVRAYDDNSLVSDDELASGVTDWDGEFNICYDNSEHSVWDSGSADVKLQFITRNTRWEVANYSDGNYVVNSSAHQQSNGSTRDWGTVTAAADNFQRALHAYDLYNQAWAFSSSKSPSAGDCWTSSDCARKKVLWQDGKDPWPQYGGSAGDAVSLPTDGPDYEWAVHHELGHNVMEHVYPDGIPESTNCLSPHYFSTNEDPLCAWIEGWPTWWASEVMNDPITSGYGDDLDAVQSWGESTSWQNYNDYSRGDNVEGRVTDALWDLSDNNNESPWDRSTVGFDQMWHTFRHYSSTSFADYVADLASDGVDTNSSDFLSTLYGNTIDSESNPFRDKLKIAWQSRPIPPISPPDLYSIPIWNASSDLPRNTSNHHNWVWERQATPSQCGESVRIESLLDSSDAYRVTASSAAFGFTNWVLAQYSDQALIGIISSNTTGSVSLKTIGSLDLALTDYPRTTYLRLSGHETNNNEIPVGDMSVPLNNHYRIHGIRCVGFLGLGKTNQLGSAQERAVGLRGEDSKRHVIQVRPTGKKAAQSNTMVRIWTVPKSPSCKKQCQPKRVAITRSEADQGRGKTLAFTTSPGIYYRVEIENQQGAAVGWLVAIN